MTFFLYGTARASTVLDASFRSFATNQTEPGDYRIGIDNLTAPFAPDGAGTLTAADRYEFRFYGQPYLTGVKGKLLDANTLQTISGPFYMVQTATPGVYAYGAVMPATAAASIVFVASDDAFNNLVIYTRRISTGARSAASAEAGIADETAIPDSFPQFLLPTELRTDK